MPDIAVLRPPLLVEILFHMADHRLTGIKLVRAHHHQALTGFVQHRVVGDHFCDVTDLQKCICEFFQRFERVILFIGPEEGLFEVVSTIVSVVFGIHAIADNKDLHILEQAAADPERIPMVAIDLVEGLFQSQTATLKFDLHQRQAVDQQRDVEAGFTRVLLGVELLHLARHLKFVLAPLLFIDKAEPLLGAVITQ